jgi:alpha-beta hydrolase superfamily lysophospholipase
MITPRIASATAKSKTEGRRVIIPGMRNHVEEGILYRRWAAPDPKAVFLLVYGFGAHSGRWEFLADYFAGRGVSSYAIELAGFGLTKDEPRGHVDSFGVYDRGIMALRETIVRENPGRKIYLVGESMGGLVAFNLACRRAADFEGLILISPAFKNVLKFPLSSYLTLVSLGLFKPRKTIPVPFTAEMCTRDASYREIMEQHPLEVRVGSLKCLLNFMAAQMRSPRLAGKLAVPSLFLLAGDDLLVDGKATRRIFGKVKAADKTLRHYPGMRHALSIELDRDKVFGHALEWLEKRA